MRSLSLGSDSSEGSKGFGFELCTQVMHGLSARHKQGLCTLNGQPAEDPCPAPPLIDEEPCDLTGIQSVVVRVPMLFVWGLFFVSPVGCLLGFVSVC